jgi:hypothetical protein
MSENWKEAARRHFKEHYNADVMIKEGVTVAVVNGDQLPVPDNYESVPELLERIKERIECGNRIHSLPVG